MEDDITNSHRAPLRARERPSRPPSQDPLISPSVTVASNVEHDQLLNRKFSHRKPQKSIGDDLYTEVEMEKNSARSTYQEDMRTAQLHPPKAFQQSQRYMGFNCGRWRIHVRHGMMFAAVFVTIFVPIWYAAMVPSNILPNESDFASPFSFDCSSSPGKINMDTLQPGLLGIDMKFGSFTFDQAKAIDLAWNLVVGRGVQAILSLIAYRVFSDALLRSAEITHLSYDLYASLSLYTNKGNMAWHLLKGLGKRGNWRTRSIFIWLLLSIVYLVSFPSILDVCSGYEPSYTTNIVWENGTISLVTDNESAWFQNNTGVTYANDYVCLEIPDPANPSNFTFSLAPHQDEDSGDNDGACGNGVSSLEVYYWDDAFLNTTWWAQFYKNATSLYDPSTWDSWGFWPSMPQNYRCIPLNGIYQWGFSSQWLMIAAIVNSVFILGLWILWVDCDLRSELCKKGRRLGLWRAVADISEAMREELGPNICAYDEWDLAEALRRKDPIKYYAEPGDGVEPGHIGLSSRRSGPLKLEWNHEYGGGK
ncbi:uncharacterized protein LY89DRAFT_780239 [Mollisia scopiformis]|uniref:Uncharacterized protein n=1 Tax=Mollisia scopiformis TaxID=149040 RepID=A0A194XGD0_MOLSC|nr:uncharacterized protein LY89DRAFT_780239 [Mollisia scopiformis]KUJ19250.1 hypothetical protein LY89DRAFT_780239 [Mollisia scopiformis]